METAEAMDRLFSYLRDLLYAPETAHLNAETLPPDCQKLAEGLRFLGRCLSEQRALGDAVASGALASAPLPDAGNTLAAPLRNVHTALSQLVRRMRQVQSGDYGKRLAYMGEVSEAFNDMTERLVQLATTDELTGLLNAAGFAERVRTLFSACPDAPYFLVAFDVNDFRRYNALYGEQQGDRLLQNIASFLRANTNAGTDACARLHADCFVCLIRDTGLARLCERIRLADRKFRMRLAYRAQLFRCGVYAVTDRKVSVREMEECARRALRAARRGEDRFIAVYDAALDEQRAWENEMLQGFSAALHTGEFLLNFQPKYDFHTGRIAGAEALVRWFRPGGEVRPPDAFIRLFERSGLIAELNLYMAEQVCQELAHERASGLSPVPVSVNFSRAHLYDPGFSGKLSAICARCDVPPRLLGVELSEKAVFEDLASSAEALAQLREAGFPVALDDFGSGFSSLRQLGALPLDAVKVDQALLRDLDADPRAGDVLALVLDLVARLGLDAVAEGVETEAQYDFLAKHGCGLAQGFYLSRPLYAEAYRKLLRRQTALGKTGE